MQLDFAQTIISAIPFGILPFMLLLPLVGAFVALIIGAKPARYLTLIIGVIELALAILLGLAIDPTLN
ncbi:MAG: hypothetical protein KAQ65_06180, partial [Candidatus Thorarchaeota archaeon]|nr:hypothetical protein [Candidatus Thorarchaeota archaeon]